MKLLSLLGLMAALVTRILPAQTPPPPSAPASVASVHFDGRDFLRASDSPTLSGSMEQYLPAGQTLAHWTCMTSIHHLATAVPDPVAATRGVAETVKRRNPDAQVLLMNNATTGDALIDFVTWPTDNPRQPAYIEYDICKYRKAPAGGLIAFQYARRAYGSDEQQLLQSLKSERQRLLPLAGQFDPQ